VTRRSSAAPRGRLRFGQRVSAFIAISEAVRDALVAGGVDPSRVAQVYPGVSPPPGVERRDWRAECGWEPEVVVAGIVGELATPGGAATVESICSSLDERARARLRLILLGGRGGGHDSLAGVRAYRAGFIHDIHRGIAGLDLLLHAGTADGLGTAVIDGMAFGVPCVAFAGGSAAEIVSDGQTGLLVPRGDVPGFARAVATLVLDGARRTALAAAGRAAAQRYDPAHLVDGVLRVYRDLVERS
jgi:glycosyltransferase involved in cell wall biosynthesis